jgi:succinate dehydrogenase / fumarate reductase cytochrome b subunit
MPVQRPLSPHLTIYKPQISTVLSILHRITGIGLFLGSALLVLWLWSAAYAPAFYPTLHDVMSSIIGKLFLLGWMAAFYYHLGNGIRHLFWDIGQGFTLPVMARSGWAVVIATVLLTAYTWMSVVGQ